MKREPLVSVIIPAYNMADFTVKTVEGVLCQSYPKIEIIVVDDGSTDDTQKKLEPFEGRIIYVRKENGGACSARNVGIRRARGEFIGLLDCDDLYMPEKIRKSVEEMEARPQAGLLHTGVYFIDGQEKIIGRRRSVAHYQGWAIDKLIVVNLVANGTAVVRRECFDKVGLFDEQLFPPADWDMWLRIGEHYQLAYLDEPLSKYRVSSNWNFKNLEHMKEEEAIVLSKFFERNPQTSASIKNKAYSRYHFTMAKCYLVKGDEGAMKEHLNESLRLNPFNLKANATRLAHGIVPERLKKYAARTMFVES